MISVATLLFVLFLAGTGTISYYGHKDKRHRYYTNICPPPGIESSDIVFEGLSLELEPAQVNTILQKHFPYYRQLVPQEQKRFLKRLLTFMQEKTFIIKDDEGFHEMPVLISAAAVQLTFGLKEYRLPFYPYIRIHPEEYFSDHAFLSVLAGNVQDNIITIAWNHFLKDYETDQDGSNVGLHEMSHALYIQKIVIEEGYTAGFDYQYSQLMRHCKAAARDDSTFGNPLYSAYAYTNMQEFWAVTVELFFERPAALKARYPDVYAALSELLNQDPIQVSDPVVEKESGGWGLKIKRITWKGSAGVI